MKRSEFTKEMFIREMMVVASEFGKAEITEVNKPTGSYTGITIRKPGVPSPVVNIDRLYIAYQEGKLLMADCKERVRKILVLKGDDMDFEFNIKDIGVWNIVKNQLYLRLVNNDANGISREIADMFLVPYIRVVSDDSAAVRVTKELIDLWGVSEEEVFAQAETNQEDIRPLKIDTLGNALGLPCPFDVFIISTTNNVNGASAIFYEGVLEDLYDRLGEFYIIPSSVHEMLAIAKENVDDPEDLKMMVMTVNANDVNVEDRLTDSIYTFNIDDKEFRKV